MVPAAAIFHGEEAGDYVLVAGSDDKAHQRKVQVGIRNKDSAQIVSGINEGDPVITSGGQSWSAKNDFTGPSPQPHSVWARYAQVLLETNEFAFID